MNAAAPRISVFAFPVSPVSPVSLLSIPEELEALLDQSPRARMSFSRLDDQSRKGMVAYVAEPRQTTVREHRAAVVAMSLYGLAADLPEDRPLADA